MPTYKANWWDSYYCGKCHKMFLTPQDNPNPGKFCPGYCPYCGAREVSLRETAGRLVIDPKDLWTELPEDLRFSPIYSKEEELQGR